MPDFDVEKAQELVEQYKVVIPHLSRWKHRKTGGLYCVGLIVLRESDGSPLVIYHNEESGMNWARPAGEFLDRFIYQRTPGWGSS